MKTLRIFLGFLLVFLLGLMNAIMRLEELGDPFSELDFQAFSHHMKESSDASPRIRCNEGNHHPWKKTERMKVLIAGGASFLGYHLCRSLLMDGHRVVVLDNLLGDELKYIPSTSRNIVNNELHMKRLRMDDLRKSFHIDLEIIEGDPCILSPLGKMFEDFDGISHIVLDIDRIGESTGGVRSSAEWSVRQKVVNLTLGCTVQATQFLKKYPHIHLTIIQSQDVKERQIYAEEAISEQDIKRLTEHLNLLKIMNEALQQVLFNTFYLHNLYVSILKVPESIGTWMSLDHYVMRWFDQVHSCKQEDMGSANHQFYTVDSLVEHIGNQLLNRCSCCTTSVLGDAVRHVDLVEIYDGIIRSKKSPKHHGHACERTLSQMEYFHLGQREILGKHLGGVSRTKVRSLTERDKASTKEVKMHHFAVEMINWYENHKDIIVPNGKQDFIFTSYLSSSNDPQRKFTLNPDNFNYMKTWYFSLETVGVPGLVFHDGLSNTFQSLFDKKLLAFQLISLENRTTNDARFYAYKNFLEKSTHIQRVLLTDISDVEFLKNPFELMNILGDNLYIGRDIDVFPNMGSMGWLKKRLEKCFGEHEKITMELNVLQKFDLVYNAGVIGGTRTIMMQFLQLVTDVLDLTPHSVNCNMPAVNYVVHKFFDGRVMAGFPLTSRFYFMESDPKDIYIIHK